MPAPGRSSLGAPAASRHEYSGDLVASFRIPEPILARDVHSGERMSELHEERA